MTRMEKFLEQYPHADVVEYKGEKSLCILPCVVDASLRGDMTRRDCAWSKRYIDCNECCVKFWGEEIG